MVRLLTPDDFDLWKTIRLHALREHPEAYGGSYEEERMLTNEEWAESLLGNHVFAYMDGELPIGVAGYFANPLKKKSHIGTVFTVYVKRKHRGKGVMDWLLGALAYHARDMGVTQLHLGVGTYNERAIRCYERNGFAAYGTEPRALKLHDEYIDEHLMVKFL